MTLLKNPDKARIESIAKTDFCIQHQDIDQFHAANSNAAGIYASNGDPEWGQELTSISLNANDVRAEESTYYNNLSHRARCGLSQYTHSLVDTPIQKTGEHDVVAAVVTHEHLRLIELLLWLPTAVGNIRDEMKFNVIDKVSGILQRHSGEPYRVMAFV